jgi:predicted sulfurtransferase
MEVKAVDACAIFRAFTAVGKDPKTLILDVRAQKDYKKGHINQAFNPRLATNGKFLADYSQAQYSMPWSQVGRCPV